MTDNLRKRRAAEGLAEHPIFKSLPADVLDALVTNATLYYLDEGDMLFEASTKANHLLAVIEGAVQIEHPTADETRGIVVRILPAPCVVGEGQTAHDRPWSVTAVAIAPVVAVGIELGLLEQTMLAYPAFSMTLYREVTARFLSNIDQRKADPERSVEEQLARYLTSVLEVRGDANTLAMSQGDIGRATGLRRETVNRVLAQWVKAGIMKLAAGQLGDIDRAKLATIGGATLVRRLSI